MRSIDLSLARRLAISRQRLAGAPPAPPGPERLLDLVRDLGCLQLDPIRAVERSQHLVLWSRLGAFDPADLDALLWRDRSLFEYWAHVASLVLTEDYPIHSQLMRGYCADPESRRARDVRIRAWLVENEALRRHVLDEVAARGPLSSRDFEDSSRTRRVTGGWNTGRDVTEMLDYLWTRGELAVAGRAGQLRLWDLAERWLPHWTPREVLDEPEVVARAAQRALRALGVATQRQIDLHFTRQRYPGLAAVLKRLAADGLIVPVELRDGQGARKGPWYVHRDDLPLLEALERGDWAPRTTLLSPFDNLICDRDRTEALWDFLFRVEIYVPPARRRYGYYVLTILHGDRLIGRIDPMMDRATGRFVVNAVFPEPEAPSDAGPALAGAIADLAGFLGADRVDVDKRRVPLPWRRALSGL
jgi:uncharacterized protein YcaQ